MSDRKRLHRADPARIAPVRNFSKLYSRPDSANGTNPGKPAQSDTSRKVRSAGPLAEGVELAYSVIDKYVAEGRRTAEGISDKPYTPRPPNDNLQDILERILRFQSEVLPLWIETLATLVKVDPARNGSAATREASPKSNGGPISETTAVSIEVVSVRPVQVSVELRPNSRGSITSRARFERSRSRETGIDRYQSGTGRSPEAELNCVFGYQTINLQAPIPA